MSYPHVEDFNYAEPRKISIVESFQWFKDFPQEFQEYGKDRDKLRLKIVSVHSGDISKNGREYTREALLKSCSSWNGLPLIVNHDANVKIGTIEFTEFENDQLEHVVTVTKQPYVDLIRNHSPEVKGVSLGASYILNKCPKCGKNFGSEETWHKHMTEEHFIKDLPMQPHGIKGTDLSLVFGKEIPGLDTSIEIMETARGFGALEEMVIAERGVFSVRAEGNAGVGKTGVYTSEPKLKEKVEKRGNQWCVVHCHGEDAGKVIKCFDNEADAQAMHNAMQAGELKVTAETANTIADWLQKNAPKPYGKLFGEILDLADRNILEYKKTRDAEFNSLPEIQQQNILKQQELALKERLVATETADSTALKNKIVEQEKKIVEYENKLDKVKAHFKGVAQTQQPEKKNSPDLTYKPGS